MIVTSTVELSEDFLKRVGPAFRHDRIAIANIGENSSLSEDIL